MEPAPGARMQDLSVEDFPGMHAYTDVAGWAPLRDALAAREVERTGVPTSPAEVLLTAGGTAGLAAAASALLAEGDEVLVLAPYWPLIAGMVRVAHGVPVEVPFFVPSAGPDPRVDPAAATALLDRYWTPRARVLYVNSPHNPTGTVLPRAVLAALAAWAQSRGLWIWSDEVYAQLCWGGVHHPMRPMAPERTLGVHSFSKAYGMAGNRCGWLVGPAEVLAEVRKVSVHTVYGAPTASQVAAFRALSVAGEWSERLRDQYAATARHAAETLGLPEPAGSTFLFFDVAHRLDARGLTGFLTDAADRGILLAPGPSFGPYPTHVRLCFTAVPPDRARRGLAVLADLLRGRS